MLQANITTQVFEPGGDASIQTQSVPYSPFPSYVGINLNQPQGRYIETDKDHVFDVITVSPDGKPVNRSGLEYKIYRISWSWWWENDNESFETYINSSSISPVATGRLNTVGGKGQFSFRVNYPDWGRYLVYVKDRESGHATGGTIYVDWPDWRGRSNKSDPSGIKMLSFSIDKDSYEPGETVTAILPASAGGRALVTLENGSSVTRELILVKIRAKDTERQPILNVTEIFHGKFVDVTHDSMVIELTGHQDKLDAFLDLLSGYEILELARTGLTGLSRGISDVVMLDEDGKRVSL